MGPFQRTPFSKLLQVGLLDTQVFSGSVSSVGPTVGDFSRFGVATFGHGKRLVRKLLALNRPPTWGKWELVPSIEVCGTILQIATLP